MTIARKITTAARLLKRDGVRKVADLARIRVGEFARANAVIPSSPARRAALVSLVLESTAEFSPVPVAPSDVEGVRDAILFPYARRSYFDVAEAASRPDRLGPLEAVLVADSLFRVWNFARLDALLPCWREAGEGTKFARRWDQLSRRVALRMGRLSEAQADLDPAETGDLADQLLRGDVWDAAGRMPQARDAYLKAVHRQPYDPLVRLNLAFHLMKSGDVLDGLASWGVADRIFGSYPLRHRRPQWGGAHLGAQTLLVVFEHGLGDMIQFARFLVPLRRREPEARIIASVPRPLVGLFRQSLAGIEIVGAEDADPPHDVFVPSVLLAPVLEAHSLEPRAGYLRLAESPVLPAPRRPVRVGVCWRGHPRQYEQTRSIPIELFSRLFVDEAAEFVVLLNALTEPEAAVLARFDNVLVPTIRDFVDLGAVMAGCDLVVSVDTAIVHLAGAAGRPCLVMSRPDACWRWGVSGPRSPWYETVEVLRHDGDMNWDAMLSKVGARVAVQGGGASRRAAVPA